MRASNRITARIFSAATIVLVAFAAAEPALAYPAGQNLNIQVSSKSVQRAGYSLKVGAVNVEPGCRVNFTWVGQQQLSTVSAVSNSLGATPVVTVVTPPFAAKYNLRASLSPCIGNTGATSAQVSITVGRPTKIICTDTASNYSARTSPTLLHDCYLKWGSRAVANHNLRVRLFDPRGTQLSWHIFTTDSLGAIHVTMRNKVSMPGSYVFDTYFVKEKTYISNSLHASIVMTR